MSTPDPSAVDWVPLYNLASAIPPVVNGQWLKGQGGVPVWAPITAGDVTVPRVKATRATALILGSGAWTSPGWDGEELDTDAIHDPATNPNRLTCKTAGVYAWAVYFGFAYGGALAANSIQAINVQKNADAISGTAGIGGTSQTIPLGIGPSLTASGVVTLNVTDFLAICLFQNSGQTVTINPTVGTAAPGSNFSMWRIA